MVGKAQIVLVRQTGEPVGGGLDQEFFRQAQLRTKGDDLLRGVHSQGGEGSGGVAVDRAVAHPVLREVRGGQHDAGVLTLGDGGQRHHPHPGGQVHRGLAAGLHA